MKIAITSGAQGVSTNRYDFNNDRNNIFNARTCGNSLRTSRDRTLDDTLLGLGSRGSRKSKLMIADPIVDTVPQRNKTRVFFIIVQKFFLPRR